MVGLVAERYTAGGVLVTQQMVDAGSVTKWMLARDVAPEYSIARKNSARLVVETQPAEAHSMDGPGWQQHQQQLAERQTAAVDSLTRLRQMRMQIR